MDTPSTATEPAAATKPADPATAEIILARHPKVLEAVVVGRPDSRLGQAWVAFVIPKHGIAPSPELRDELRQSLARHGGPAALVSELRFPETLPKTRSGKILRRTLQEIAAGNGDRPD